MHESRRARAVGPALRSISLCAVALTAIALTPACTDNDGVRAPANAGGNGGTSGASAAGSAGRTVAGSAGTIVSDAGAGGDAGVGGDSGAAGDAGATGDAGAAGEAGTGPVSNCLPGGAPLVVGNYVDATGNQFLLRSAAKAATFALVPAGAANPAKLPRLFVIDRVCAVGKALIASDESSSYRVDFTQAGNRLSVCLSAPVATLDAAVALPSADVSHAADTGCAGKPFTVYTAEAL